MKQANEPGISLSDFYLVKSLKPLLVLLTGLLLTAVSIFYTWTYIEKTATQEFEHASIDLQGKMEARLRAHAQLLRSGAAYFAVSDTVTRDSWRRFYEHMRVDKHLPGIQGFGYTKIILPHELEDHTRRVRESGFPDYTVYPSGERELYTSIIYLEPFTDRNLRAFGYDMFSEPVRRKAMETARDSNFAVLSGKVFLVQETGVDIQAGALMYIPVYRQGMPVETVEQRRAAIKGWVYSPYRIRDLTHGILGNWDLPGRNRIHLRIFDQNDFSEDSLLYDSQTDQLENENPNLSLILPVRFNDREWMMVFTRNSEELSLFHGDLMVVTLSGIIISILLFFLTSSLIKTSMNAKHIAQLNRELEKLNADKDRFISILGHDLRNPFNSILGYLEILITDFDILERDKIEIFIKRINSASHATYNLLEDLLNWSRARAGTLYFNPQCHNLNDVFKYIKRNMITQAKIKKISLNCSVNPDIVVFADIEMLKTILRNLCSNAIKFTGEHGEVNVTAEEDHEQVKITVADNGIGMKPAILKNLFTVTQPLTTSGTENEPGSGMGLMLCKEFVNMHGGQIRAESQAGKGSRFIVTLPREKEKTGQREKASGEYSVGPVS
jgi:signal transduction histidine kinase